MIRSWRAHAHLRSEERRRHRLGDDSDLREGLHRRRLARDVAAARDERLDRVAARQPVVAAKASINSEGLAGDTRKYQDVFDLAGGAYGGHKSKSAFVTTSTVALLGLVQCSLFRTRLQYLERFASRRRLCSLVRRA